MSKMKYSAQARLADPEDRDGVEHAIKWCKRFHTNFNGFHFDDELAGPDGVALTLFVPEGTEHEEIEKALDEAYQQRDIVYHRTLVCPSDWLI